MQSKSHFLIHFIPGILLGSVVGLAFGSLLVASQIPASAPQQTTVSSKSQALVDATMAYNVSKAEQERIAKYGVRVSSETASLFQKAADNLSTSRMRGDAESAPSFAEDYAAVLEINKDLQTAVRLMKTEISVGALGGITEHYYYSLIIDAASLDALLDEFNPKTSAATEESAVLFSTAAGKIAEELAGDVNYVISSSATPTTK